MLREIVETAIKMETDSIAFYQEAAEKSGHPFGREMFKGFVKDEKRHLVILRAMLKGSDFDAEFVRPKDSIRTVFSSLKDQMMEKVKAVASELDALKIALKFEKEGYDFYLRAAQQAAEQREKELLQRLAAEENDHYALLNETYSFLENTGNWFMYEERGILEG